MESPDLNILICGKIRDVDELASGIKTYASWKRQGLVNRVVFSGWSSDWNIHQKFLEGVTAQGFEIVLSPEPDFIVHGYIFHQAKTLRYGLAQFGPRDRVLKTRTDKAMLDLNLTVLKARFDGAPPPSLTSPFRHRVMILGGLPLQPFFFNDMLFVGEAADLRKAASFDLWFECHNALINAEQALHIAPYVARDPMIRDYFMVNPGLVHGDQQMAIDVQLAMLSDPFYLRVLHRSLAALRDGYVVGFHDHAPWTPPAPGLTLEAIVRSGPNVAIDGLSYMAEANSLAFHRIEPAHVLLGVPISSDNPLNLLQVAEAPAPAPTDDILSPEARAFADRIGRACPGLALPPPVPFTIPGVTIYHGRAPLVRARA